MSAANTLYLCTYNRGKDLRGATKPYHWALFISNTSANSEQGVVHQLRGMPGGFYYPGTEDSASVSNFGPGPMEEMVEIGAIPQDSVGSVEGILEQLEIVKDESAGWNCQSWTEAAFAVLKEKGWVYQDFKAVKDWVKEK